MTPTKHPKILILSKARYGKGGVAAFNRSLLNNADKIQFTGFDIGSRGAGRSGGFSGLIWLIVDAIKLSLTLRRETYDAVLLNPSFNIKSLLRDMIFFVICLAYKKKTAIFFHGWDQTLCSKIQKKTNVKKILSLAFKKCHLFFVLASSFKKQLIEFDISADRITLSLIHI